ncbi:MAG TPA: hypothetical protein VHY59_08480 [Chthoniobacterales bacterium]|jgi:hypothetical protein|nr:hypothetical protein [Chthoniobacterales bacterium]
MLSVRSIGLKKYLEGSKAFHGDWGYDEFVAATDEAIEVDGIKVKLLQRQIAERMKVDRATIREWQQILREERASASRVR